MTQAQQVETVRAADTSFLLRSWGSKGPGTPALLLHGVPQTATCWAQVAPRLADGRRVLAPDLPGLGGSAFSGPFDVPTLVRQLAALVEREVPGGVVDVVGHDWGGSLALALAGARPELVRRLVVVNAPYRQVPLLRAAYIPLFALPVLPELLLRLGGRRAVDLMLDLPWRAAHQLDPVSRSEYTAAYTRPASVAAMLGYYRGVARPRAAALLRGRRSAASVPRSRISVERALVLWGALDPVLPVRIGEAVVRDLGADCVMVTVPGAGHFLPEEAPQVVLDVLRDVLADVTTPEPEVTAAPPERPGREGEPIEAPPGAPVEPA